MTFRCKCVIISEELTLCIQVIMRNLTTEEVSVFTYEEWLSRIRGPKRTMICEMAAVVDEETMVELTTYIIQVKTSDVAGKSSTHAGWLIKMFCLVYRLVTLSQILYYLKQRFQSFCVLATHPHGLQMSVFSLPFGSLKIKKYSQIRNKVKKYKHHFCAAKNVLLSYAVNHLATPEKEADQGLIFVEHLLCNIWIRPVRHRN